MMYLLLFYLLVKNGKTSEDTFGMDDSDWNVYRAIVSHTCSTASTYQLTHAVLPVHTN